MVFGFRFDKLLSHVQFLSSLFVNSNIIVACVGSEIVRGDPDCHDEPWTECSTDCTQTRKAPSPSYKQSADATTGENKLSEWIGCYHIINILFHVVSYDIIGDQIIRTMPIYHILSCLFLFLSHIISILFITYHFDTILYLSFAHPSFTDFFLSFFLYFFLYRYFLFLSLSNLFTYDGQSSPSLSFSSIS